MVKKIKTLHLRSSNGLFGAEGVILTLSQKLEILGVENYIICIQDSKSNKNDFAEEARRKGLNIITASCSGRLDFKTILFIGNFIKENRIDILHCHDYKADFFGILASCFFRVKLVATNHLWTSETISLRFYEFLDGILLNFFDRIVAVSDKVAKDIRPFLLFKKRLATIYNGIDLYKYKSEISKPGSIKKEFNIGENARVIGTVGRLSPQKGFNYFLEAAQKVSAIFPEASFLIVGDGVLKESLKEKARESAIENRIIFTGTRNDMENIYDSLDIFVMSSIKEGLPLALLEALAMRKPVVATNVGGIPAVVKSGRTGILVEPKNSNSLANAITDLLRDTKRAESLAFNGRRFVEDNFSAATMANAYKELYEQILL